ncbi:NAD(P)H-dependent flavin oxidoreductase [Paenibacillus glucanolyticus]|uniref:NAD(P)H-dependent flavin oxidoreductase n=1 Tax=Paenibacillus glucanolyticus TaxID=59843 RepID=UPI0036B3C55C
MNMQLYTELCQRFGIRYPVFLAGMAGGPSTADLVAAVSDAGGLGTLGAAYMEPAAIRQSIQDIRKLTDKPFAVNLFASTATQASDNLDRIGEVQHELNRMRETLGIPQAGADQVAAPDWFEKQFTVLLEEKVPVISTAFGILPEPLMRQAKAANLLVVTMVTTVNEALMAEQAGCDAIVAQGSDAGGHRGTFDLTEHPMGANIGTFSLVPQIVDQVKIPVIAAGGVMDGRGLVASLVLGAQGVQMGTRFLTALESGAHEVYKQALLESTEESTVITQAFSGRPARGIRNAFIRRWDATGLEPLLFPVQNTVTRDIRNAANRQNNPDYMSLWAGQGTRRLTSGQRAKAIVYETIQEALSLCGSSEITDPHE